MYIRYLGPWTRSRDIHNTLLIFRVFAGFSLFSLSIYPSLLSLSLSLSLSLPLSLSPSHRLYTYTVLYGFVYARTYFV